MNLPNPHQEVAAFGSLLRHWRMARRVSQLALATDAEISGRHLSFLETGRAQPSRDMVQRLATVLDVPLDEQNAMLVAAGFAPIFGQRELSAPDLEHARRALEFILRQQEPFPAIVVDGQWDIVMRNNAADRMFGLFVSETQLGRASGRNAMRTLFHPEGIRQYVQNWEELAGPLIQSLHREAASSSTAARLRDELLAYPGVPSPWKVPDPFVPTPPLLAMRVKKGEVEASFFSMLTTFATPRDITLQQLRIECFYPADAETEALARRLATT